MKRFDINAVMDTLIKKRIIVLSVLGAVLAASLAAGYIYQSRKDKEDEAADLFDEAWQNIAAVVQDVQQPNHVHVPGDDHTVTVEKIYQRALETLDTLTLDYADTVAGARAALILIRISDEPTLKPLQGTNQLHYTVDGYLDEVKKKHPDFWGSAIYIAEGISYEKKGQFAEAIGSYESALKTDKKNYLSDYVLISIARNKEILNDVEGAVDAYQEMLDRFPLSSWGNFAMGKVYLLTQSE